MNKPKPAIILVECEDWDQVDMAISKGMEDEYHAIASASGVVLFRDKERAIDAFNSMVQAYITLVSGRGYEGLVPITTMKTAGGIPGISFGINTPNGGYLFGVSEEDYMAAASSHGFVRKEKLN